MSKWFFDWEPHGSLVGKGNWFSPTVVRVASKVPRGKYAMAEH